jgi:hypothetical protein
MSETNKNEPKHVLIDTVTQCIKVVEEIMLKQSVISVDCEGVMLSKAGRLTLMQVYLNNIDWIS